MTYDFPPERRTGLVLHIVSAIVLATGSGLSMYFALQQNVGANFVLLILVALALFVPLPLVVYRGYALLTAGYSVERDGLRLRWGLLAEDLPLPDIEWVRPAADLTFDLPLPRLSWPGAILGSLNVRDFGRVEYLASDKNLILLVATRERVYAISPADPVAFVRAFQHATEMGSLTPLDSFSARPAAFLRGVWSDRLARALALAGLLLTGVLFILVSLMIPTRAAISLGFTPGGQPVAASPSAQLLLLPVLGIFTFVTDLIGGLYYYRYPAQRPVAYLLFISSILTPLLLMAAVGFLA